MDSSGSINRRLLLLCPTSGIGGCESYALSIAQEATKRGYSCIFALPLYEATADFWHSCAGQGLEMYPLNFRAGRAFWQEFLEGIGLIWKFHPLRVVVVLPWPEYGLGYLAWLGLSRIRTVVVFQFGAIYVELPKWKRFLLKVSSRASQRWVAVSEHNQQILADIFKRKTSSIEVIKNGVSEEVMGEVPEERRLSFRRSLSTSLGVSQPAIFALSVGRIEWIKAFDVLIRELPNILGRFPQFYLLIAGTGSKRAELEQLSQELQVTDRVIFLGQRSDIPELMRACDIFLFPSRGEGLSFALLEALASELPVVASNSTSNCELIRDRFSGLIFDIQRPTDLSEQVFLLLSDSGIRSTLVAGGRLVALEHTREKMFDSTFKLLK